MRTTCHAMPEMVRAVSRERLVERWGVVRDATLEQVLWRAAIAPPEARSDPAHARSWASPAPRLARSNRRVAPRACAPGPRPRGVRPPGGAHASARTTRSSASSAQPQGHATPPEPHRHATGRWISRPPGTPRPTPSRSRHMNPERPDPRPGRPVSDPAVQRPREAPAIEHDRRCRVAISRRLHRRQPTPPRAP